MHRAIAALAISAIAMLTPTCSSAAAENNEQVARQIRDTLRTSGRLSGYSFVIKYQDGTAWLDGRVSTADQKALAVEMTSELPNVSKVVDHLRIEPRDAGAVPVSAEETVSPASGPVVKVARLHRLPLLKGRLSASRQNDAQEQAPDESQPTASQSTASQPTASQPTADAELLSAVEQVAEQPAESLQPIPETQAELAEPAPLPMPRQVMRQTASRRFISNNKARKANTRQAASSHAQQGHVRMVPMMEMPDGRLVPVRQAQRQPLGQPVSTHYSSNRRGQSNRRSSTHHVVNHASQLDGPVDVGPMPVAPVPSGMLPAGPMNGAPLPAYVPGVATGAAPAYYDQPHMPNYSWPAYASYPNYAGLTYPRQYSPTAWPYIGPFYPYPQVPLGWRKVTLEWDDGWWFLDFDDTNRSYAH